jgi:hypothetical protein
VDFCHTFVIFADLAVARIRLEVVDECSGSLMSIAFEGWRPVEGPEGSNAEESAGAMAGTDH